jgi:hypothetical protein
LTCAPVSRVAIVSALDDALSRLSSGFATAEFALSMHGRGAPALESHREHPFDLIVADFGFADMSAVAFRVVCVRSTRVCGWSRSASTSTCSPKRSNGLVLRRVAQLTTGYSLPVRVAGYASENKAALTPWPVSKGINYSEYLHQMKSAYLLPMALNDPMFRVSLGTCDPTPQRITYHVQRKCAQGVQPGCG